MVEEAARVNQLNKSIDQLEESVQNLARVSELIEVSKENLAQNQSFTEQARELNEKIEHACSALVMETSHMQRGVEDYKRENAQQVDEIRDMLDESKRFLEGAFYRIDDSHSKHASAVNAALGHMQKQQQADLFRLENKMDARLNILQDVLPKQLNVIQTTLIQKMDEANEKMDEKITQQVKIQKSGRILNIISVLGVAAIAFLFVWFFVLQ